MQYNDFCIVLIVLNLAEMYWKGGGSGLHNSVWNPAILDTSIQFIG